MKGLDSRYGKIVGSIGRIVFVVVKWIFLFAAIYITLGAWIYPFWWKRFLFEGGAFSAEYWRFAYQFLATWLFRLHPITVTLLVASVVGGMALTYYIGKEGVVARNRILKGPAGLTIAAVSGVLLVTLLSLVGMQGTFHSPDEVLDALNAEGKTASERVQRSFDEIIGLRAPKSGLYVYLDSEKIDEAFSTLQKDLTLSLERTTQEDTKATEASIGVSSLDLSKVATHQIQKSIEQTPTQATPARKAHWLVEQYRELRIVDRLSQRISDEQGDSWELKNIREGLKARGVELTKQQQMRLLEGDNEVRLGKFAKEKAPIFFNGELKLAPAEVGIKVSFKASHAIDVHGYLKEDSIDYGLHSCIQDGHRSGQPCTVNSRLLGQVLSATLDGKVIKLSVIPIAIW